MTYKQLAEFILNKMPKDNLNNRVTLYDTQEGKFFSVIDFTPFDAEECPNEDNFYSIDFHSDEFWN